MDKASKSLIATKNKEEKKRKDRREDGDTT